MNAQGKSFAVPFEGLPDGFAVAEYGAKLANPALQQIADDVAGAALYSLLAVAADPGAPLPEDSIEDSFCQDVLASAPQGRRREIAETASALISMPDEGRVAFFGRAGRRMPKDHLANGGMENYEDGAPPLKLDPKFLGRDDKITLRVSPQNLRRENDRLSMPLPRGAEEERLSAIGRDTEATEEWGVFDEDRILAKFQLPPGIPAQSHVPTFDHFTTGLPPLKHNAVSFRLVVSRRWWKLAARVRKHGGRDQAARSRSVGERSRVCQPSTRRMVI